MKNKNIYIIIAAAGLLLLILLALGYLIWAPKKNKATSVTSSTYQPEFLNAGEKQTFGLPTDAKVQAFRDAQGGVKVYKIIRNDSEIVSNPSQVGPISPRQK